MGSHQPTHAQTRDGSRHSLPPVPTDTGVIAVVTDAVEANPEPDDTDEVNAPASSLLMSILGWTLLTALVLMAFFSAVGALNRDMYSASGFVRSYLQMLAARDVAGVLGVPGVAANLPEAGSDRAVLIDARALGEIKNIQIVRDDDLGGGRHRVTAHYDLVSGSTTLPGSTEFVVQSTPPTLGILNAWRFDRSPIATLTPVVQNSAIFSVGGVTVNQPASDDGQDDTLPSYPVLVPGLYSLSHSSYYLAAAPTTTAVTTVGADARGYLDVRANSTFANAVQERVNEALDACAEQDKLYPTGCPFGKSIEDRIVGEPQWTITEYPAIRIIPGFGAWYVPQTSGVARLHVTVRSLFDGTVSERDYDVPFSISPRAKLDDRNTITLSW